MKIQFTLSQYGTTTNSKGKKVQRKEPSFKFVKVEQMRDDENEIKVVSQVIASFCKDVIKLTERNAKNGFNTGFRIKKSHPMKIQIIGLDENDDLSLSIEYRNFAKFVYESTEAQIKNVINDQLTFTAKWMQ